MTETGSPYRRSIANHTNHSCTCECPSSTNSPYPPNIDSFVKRSGCSSTMGTIVLGQQGGHHSTPSGQKLQQQFLPIGRKRLNIALGLLLLAIGTVYCVAHRNSGEDGTFIWAGEKHHDGENQECHRHCFKDESCLDENEDKLLSTQQQQPQGTTFSSIETCLKAEFKKYGATLIEVQLSADLIGSDQKRKPSLVMIASGNGGYKYAPTWMKNRQQDGASYARFTSSATIRNGELTSHYSRIPSLLASMVCLPHVPAFVYTDMDTLIDYRKVQELVSNSACPVAISWKEAAKSRLSMRQPGQVMRTNWFMVKNNRPGVLHFLLTWYYNGRTAKHQDQTIFNELFAEKPWFRDMLYAIRVGTPLWNSIELKHCFSGLQERQRTQCIESLTLANFVK
jgi:hypothetical protein